MAKGSEKVSNPYGRVLHDRGTKDKPSKYEGVGNERKPDLKGTQGGGSREEGADPVGRSHLGHAVKELHEQHPHHHSVGGVHHTKDHVRHEPMHGMEGGSSHRR